MAEKRRFGAAEAAALVATLGLAYVSLKFCAGPDGAENGGGSLSRYAIEGPSAVGGVLMGNTGHEGIVVEYPNKGGSTDLERIEPKGEFVTFCVDKPDRELAVAMVNVPGVGRLAVARAAEGVFDKLDDLGVVDCPVEG